jgi:phospholipase/lecithinase/hemolysin
VDTKLVKPYATTVHSLIDQVTRDYMPAYSVTPASKRRAQWTAENSLFLFFIGINDVLNTYSANNTSLISKIFSEYADMVEKVYNSGARNYLFLDVPSLQNSPMSKKYPGSLSTEVIALKNWANRLDTLVQTLRSKHPDVMAQTFSTYAVFDRIFQNPKSYQQTSNLKDVTGFCEQYSK